MDEVTAIVSIFVVCCVMLVACMGWVCATGLAIALWAETSKAQDPFMRVAPHSYSVMPTQNMDRPRWYPDRITEGADDSLDASMEGEFAETTGGRTYISKKRPHGWLPRVSSGTPGGWSPAVLPRR